jgi:hypothetical protein
MNLFEAAKKNKTDIPTAISNLLKKYFSIETEPDDVRSSIKNMSLVDMIELDNAISSRDIDRIEGILKSDIKLEYTMPNRGQLISKASETPKPDKVSSEIKSTDTTDSNNKDTNNKDTDSSTAISSMGPSELKNQKEIDDATAEIEKLKKIAGVK